MNKVINSTNSKEQLTGQFLGFLSCLRDNIDYHKDFFLTIQENNRVCIDGFKTMSYHTLQDVATYFGTDEITIGTEVGLGRKRFNLSLHNVTRNGGCVKNETSESNS